MEKKEIRRYIFIAVLAVAVCFVVQNFTVFQSLLLLSLQALRPITIGCCLAYVFNILMKFLEKHYLPNNHSKSVEASRRPVCLILSLSFIIALIALMLNIIIPEIINAGKLIYNELPPLFIKGRDFVLDKMHEYPQITEQLEDIEIDKSALVEKATNGAYGLFGSMLSIIGAVTNTVTNIVIGLIFAIYLLLRKDKLLTDVNRILNVTFSEDKNKKIRRFFSMAHETFTNFFIGQFAEAILLGTLTFIGASILKLPYAAMTGAIIGVTALIPIVGALVGAALSAIVICTVSPMKALVFLIFLVILQQIDNNLMYPKIVGTSVGLPGIWVLAAVTVGGSLFGIAGMLLGVPLAATIYKLYFQDLEHKEAEMGITVPVKAEKQESKPDKKKAPAKRTPHKNQRKKK